MTPGRYHVLPPSVDRSALESGLSSLYALDVKEPATDTRQYHDTFDWRLWRRGLRLYRSGILYQLDSSGDASGVLAPTPARPARFAEELPAGPLRRTLAPVLEMRALLKVVDLTLRSERFTLTSKKGEVVLRGAFVELAAERSRAPRATATMLLIEPVAGKDRAPRRVKDLLHDLGAEPRSVDLLDWATRRLGIAAGAYSSKIRVDFPPTAPARMALHVILRQQLRVLKQNEAGVTADVDTEFLHDYRVTARRTHVVLTRFKGVMPPAVHTHFRRGFAGLRAATGQLRDLDVYLLDEARYRGLVAQDLKPGLDLLFEQLRAERLTEQRRLAQVLKGEAYRDFRDQWERYLEGDDPAGAAPSELANTPVATLVGQRIARQSAKVWEQAGLARPDSPDEDLHRLRIGIKKLRYLLEFFDCILPRERTRPLVKRLKALQTALGRCNDLSVQREFLRLRLEKSPGTDGPEALTAAAIGGLMAALDAQQRGARQVFLAANTVFLEEAERPEPPRP